MTPVLLLNHAVLEGLAYRAEAGTMEEREAAKRPVVEIADTLQRARRVRRAEAVLHVHPALAAAEVSAEETFITWANRHRRSQEWGAALDLLLQLLAGPWVQSLPVDDGPCPTDTTPSCLDAPEWLVETVLTAAHHGISHGRSSVILSYGPAPYLVHRLYQAEREDRRVDLHNLRSDAEAAEAEATLSKAGVKTTLEVLEEATRHALRVRVLEPARAAAKRWELDCNPAVLFDAVRGLDAYAQALDEGLPREAAAERYKLACGVDMSQEKAQTLKKPTLREQRKRSVPGFAEKQLFDMHAKPGSRTRVHVFACKEPRDEADPEKGEHTVVYVGHCGEHLDLK